MSRFCQFLAGILFIMIPLTASGASPTKFLGGDVNADGTVNITDPIVLLNYLFLGGGEPGCLAAAKQMPPDEVELTDAIQILRHLFTEGYLFGPHPYCGALVGNDGNDSCRSSSCDNSDLVVELLHFDTRVGWAQPQALSSNGEWMTVVEINDSDAPGPRPNAPAFGQFRWRDRVEIGPYESFDPDNFDARFLVISNTGRSAGRDGNNHLFIYTPGIGVEQIKDEAGAAVEGDLTAISANGKVVAFNSDEAWLWTEGEPAAPLVDQRVYNLRGTSVEAMSDDGLMLGGTAGTISGKYAALYEFRDGKWNIKFPDDTNTKGIQGSVRALSRDGSRGVILTERLDVYVLNTRLGLGGEARKVGRMPDFGTDEAPRIADVAISGDTPFIVFNRGWDYNSFRPYLWTPHGEVELNDFFRERVSPSIVGHSVWYYEQVNAIAADDEHIVIGGVGFHKFGFLLRFDADTFRS